MAATIINNIINYRLIGCFALIFAAIRGEDVQHRSVSTGIENVTRSEYCESETFHPQCMDGYVVLMIHALYGRMRLGRCVTSAMGFLGCNKDVVRLADTICSGLQECSIRLPDSSFDATQPCNKEMKTYLEASYACVPVSMPHEDFCGSTVQIYPDIRKAGYLMLRNAERQDWCGATYVEWEITALPGQQIDINLLDFSLTENPSRSNILCNNYGEVSEPSLNQPVSICRRGGHEVRDRLQHVHLSQIHMVTIRLTISGAMQHDRRFMIMYQAVGCPDLEGDPGTWFKRLSDTQGEYGCDRGGFTRKIFCQHNQWQGVTDPCALSVAANKTDVKLGKHGNTKPGATALLAAGIACGLTVVTFIVGIFVTRCVARYRGSSRTTHHTKHNTVITKDTAFPPNLYSSTPSQQCGLCTEVAPFLATTADGKSTTLRYQCVHHGGGPMSPPADWIYQCGTTGSQTPGAPSSSTGTLATIARDSPRTLAALSRDTSRAQDNQSAGDYMLYMCPGHEVMEQRLREGEDPYQRRPRDVMDQGQLSSGICGEIQTDNCTCDTSAGVCVEQYGGVCTSCDCMTPSDLVNCSQQKLDPPVMEETTNVTSLNIKSREVQGIGNEERDFIKIQTPPVQ